MGNRQPDWTLHEAVILLDGYFETVKGEQPRLRVIKRVSEDLRTMAINNNISIDDVYRNENGIAFQMQSVESACLGHTVKGKPATKLFADTVELYNSDRQQYEKILKEAKAIIKDEKTTKKRFAEGIGNYSSKTHIRDVAIEYTMRRGQGNDSENEVLLEKPRHEETPLDPVLLAVVRSILLQYFARGYRCGDSIALDIFKSHFADSRRDYSAYDDTLLERYIKSCGAEYNGLIYCPETIMDDKMEQKVIAAIERNFAQGVTVVFFESLFNEYADDFLDHNVYDADMLKAYLTYKNNGRYHIESNCLKQDKDATMDPVAEVEGLLLHTGRPMDILDIIDTLFYIPEGKIRSVFYTTEKIKSGGRGIVFHVDTFSVTDDDLADISKIIRNLIMDKGFATSAEVLNTLRQNNPHILENNAYFRDTGIRNAIEYHLNDMFTFNNNIITAHGTTLSAKDLFIHYAKQRGYFTKDELHEFARSINTQIYFDAVNTVSMRINNTNYVPNDDAKFDVAATDNAISMYCTDDYMPISDVDSFILFPNAGHPWNSYLLESYVAKFSEQFKLIHVDFAENGTAGVVVRKTSKYSDLASIVTDELAHSNCVLKKAPALVYLVERGFIVSRRWDHMEALLDKAQIIRSNRG